MSEKKMASAKPHPTREELEGFLQKAFPRRDERPGIFIEVLDNVEVRLRLPFSERMLRPGGTISGPVLMSLADTAVYVLIMRNLGLEAAMAVTSNLNMSFMRRPPPVDLLAHGRVLKMGRRLVVGDVSIASAESSKPVAHAMVTYALP